MALARGANTRLAFKFEGTYGTNPGGTDWLRLPFNPPLDLGPEQQLLESPTIGVGATRDAADPDYDAITVAGTVDVPLSLVELGYWLKLLFGAASTSGSSDYTHVFKSGTTSALPSASMEVGLPDIPTYGLATGVRANTMELQLGATGRPQLRVGLIGQDWTKADSSVDATLTGPSAYEKFQRLHATLKRNGSALGNVTQFNLSFSNNLDPVRSIGAGDNIEEAVEQDTQVSGSMSVRIANDTLLDDSEGTTPIALELDFTISSTKKLILTVPRVFVPRAKNVIQGRNGVTVTFPWRGAYDTSEACSLKAQLLNQTASY